MKYLKIRCYNGGWAYSCPTNRLGISYANILSPLQSNTYTHTHTNTHTENVVWRKLAALHVLNFQPCFGTARNPPLASVYNSMLLQSMYAGQASPEY